MDNADAMEVDAAPPPPAQQRAEMLACDPAGSLVAGTHYYLVEQKWFNTWTEFSTAVENAEPPGPIDNEPLLEPVVANSATADAAAPRALRLGQREGEHYHICTEAAWAKLHGWYGGGPPIRRAAHQASAWARNDVQLDLILLNLKVHIACGADAEAQARADAAPLVLPLSKHDLVSAATALICEAWGLDAAKVRLWDYYNQSKYAMLTEQTKSLDDAKLYANQDILAEVQGADGTWPYGEKPDEGESGTSMDIFDGAGTNNTSNSGWATGGWGSFSAASSTTTTTPARSGAWAPSSSGDSVVDSSAPSQPGVVGLSNLGNTCFMNSMLQSLSHVSFLREYCLDGSWGRDLNKTNPLGTSGELTEAFAGLLKLLWGNTASTVSPRGFKWVLGRHASQFSGYSQHDSQEFCNFVLDAMHEDLNRVVNKPYVENYEPKEGEEVRDAHFHSQGASRDTASLSRDPTFPTLR